MKIKQKKKRTLSEKKKRWNCSEFLRKVPSKNTVTFPTSHFIKSMPEKFCTQNPASKILFGRISSRWMIRNFPQLMEWKIKWETWENHIFKCYRFYKFRWFSDHRKICNHNNGGKWITSRFQRNYNFIKNGLKSCSISIQWYLIWESEEQTRFGNEKEKPQANIIKWKNQFFQLQCVLVYC